MPLRVQWDTHSYTQGNHPLIQLSHFWEPILKKERKKKRDVIKDKCIKRFAPVLFKIVILQRINLKSPTVGRRPVSCSEKKK